MSFEKRIRLFGNDYILVGDLENGGTIATEKQYQNFECSFAHLAPDGNIMRFREVIGTRKDIELSTTSVDVEIEAGMGKVLDAFLNYGAWAQAGREKQVYVIDLLLINPGSKDNYKGMDDLKAIEPPVWSGMIAHQARERGVNVQILDANAENLSPVEVALRVWKIQPKKIIVVVMGHNPSASTTIMPAAGEICKEIKRSYDCHIGMVGGHPSSLPQRTMEEEAVDEVYHVKDLTGQVAWDLLPMGLYRAHNWHCFSGDRQPYAALYTSLGCPYSCEFCCIHAPLAKRYEAFSPKSVITQIEILLSTYGVTNIKFADELFVMDTPRVNTICDYLIKKDYGLNIWAYGRVDCCPPKLLKKLKKAGVNWVCLGIDDGKGGDPYDAVRNLKYAGINVLGNYMFGLPDDDMESMRLTLDLALDLDCEFVNFNATMAFPGSKLYDQTPKKDLPDSWEGYAQYSYECQPLPTKHLTSAEVLQFRDQAFQTYFTNPDYLSMMESKFGKETRSEIEGMKMEFERRITSQNVCYPETR